MSNVPKAVREQAEKAKKLHQEVYAKDTDPAPGDGGQHQRQDPPPPPASSGNGNDAFADLRAENERLKQAHKTLQGKYDAEVPRLNSELKKLREQSQRNEQELAEAKERAKKAEEAIRNELGDSVTESLSTIVDQRAREIAREESQNNRPQGGDAVTMEDVQAEIFKAFPDFQKINTSPEFIEWLTNTVDDGTGLTMKELINISYRRLDALAVIRVVRTFVREKEQGGKRPYEHIAPPRGTQQRPTVDGEQVTAADFQRHQRERIDSKNFTRGPWAGKRAEWEAMERKIHAAIHQNATT